MTMQTEQESPAGNMLPHTPEAIEISPTLHTSPEALDRMTAWGLTEQDIANLEKIAGAYEYGNCAAKIERVVANGTLIDTERNQVVLPSYSEFEGPRRDGHCADIGVKVYCGLNQEWVAGINEHRQAEGQPPLDVLYCAGSSRTHFVKPTDRHIWTSVVPRDKPIEEALIVDGSFGVALTAEQSGYTPREWFQPTSLHPPTAAQFDIGEVATDKKGRLTSLR